MLRSDEAEGDRLVITDATANPHVARILQKLGVRDRVQVVMDAYESGLVTPGSAGDREDSWT